MQLVVPLDSFGQSENGHARPGSGKQRIADLEPGDNIVHGGRVYRILGVSEFPILEK